MYSSSYDQISPYVFFIGVPGGGRGVGGGIHNTSRSPFYTFSIKLQFSWHTCMTALALYVSFASTQNSVNINMLAVYCSDLDLQRSALQSL